MTFPILITFQYLQDLSTSDEHTNPQGLFFIHFLEEIDFCKLNGSFAPPGKIIYMLHHFSGYAFNQVIFQSFSKALVQSYYITNT